ncbi:MAG: ISL3 family transposase [Rhodoferax sp.]|nr:ISL3 family transposase [Rhodoferax sp.]
MQEDKACLPFWKGFRVADLQVEPALVRVLLHPDDLASLCCGRCGRPATGLHEQIDRSIRDLPMLGRTVWLQVQLRRVCCGHCGTGMQQVAWLDRHARMTRRLAQAVALWCAKLPVKHVAAMFELHWSTVREIHRRRLRQFIEALPEPQPRRLVMDEFALHKGHRYASVVLDADTRRVLWIGQGRSRAAVRPFFESLGPVGCERIEAVAMDMNTAFDLEVRRHCPQARIVYDLFHVVAKYGREVISRVRVDAANRLRQDKPARRVIKQSHWLLLRNRANLKVHEQVRLDEVLAANQPLLTVYVMAEQLKSLWRATCPEPVQNFVFEA